MQVKQGRFFWKLFAGNALLLVGVVGTCVLLLIDAFDAFYSAELTGHLHTIARVLQHEYADSYDGPQGHVLSEVANELGDGGGGVRVTFVDAAGQVLGDSHADAEEMDSHANRTEIREAIETGFGESTRFSNTVSKEMKYVAVRVGPVDAPAGVVRVAMPVGSIVARTQAARQLFWRVSGFALVAAVILALGLARLWSRRIAQVTATARTLSHGDLSARAEDSGSDEVALLARSLNRMRDHQAAQLETIDRQRRTLEYLLAKLHEGVIVADAEGRVILINPAASKLLNLAVAERATTGEAAGLSAEAGELSLPDEVKLILQPNRRRSEGLTERRIILERSGGSVTLLARASDISLPDLGDNLGEDGGTGGRLLVLTDITELTHTIQVKTDFVANASHELRTPLSAIRAAVETLMSIDLVAEGESARPLLSVIDRHSERLNAIVADLLDLSRIESGARRFEASRLRLAPLCDELRERFGERLVAKNLNWHVDLEPGADVVAVNRELFVLVLDNLVDNAIKFTAEHGHITVSSRSAEGQVCVSVEDDGCGIAPEEQERVFERFYQVERARSGAKRGTGLGLAIVRHALNAMHAQVTMHSVVGAGTRLDVFVPAAPTPAVSA